MSLEASEIVDAEACVECFVLANQIHPGILLLQGPPKCGKSMFCRNFVRRARYLKRPVAFATTDEDPESVYGEFANMFGEDLAPDTIRVVDCYRWRLGARGGNSRFLSSNTGDLNDLSITLQKSMEGLTRPAMIVDSLTSVAIDAGEDPCLKCLRLLLPRVRSVKGFGLFTVSEGVHSTQFINTLRTIFDGIIEMRVEEGDGSLKRLVRVYALKGAPPRGGWTTFEITDKGIKIGTPLYRAKFALSAVTKAATQIIAKKVS